MATVTQKGRKTVEKKAAALQQLRIEYVPVGSITPNSYNPNRQSDHDFELLLRSIQEDGFTQPIVCQLDRKIIDGEHRWTAVIVLDHLLKHNLAWTTEIIRDLRERRLELITPELDIPTVFTDMTAEQMRIATLRHNRARGSEDIELSTQVLRDLEAMGALDWAADSLMMSDAEIQKLLDNIPAPEALASEEFGLAWEPSRVHENEMTHSDTTARTLTSTAAGLTEVTAMSALAVAQAHEREKRIEAAKSEEEKQMIARDMRIYRLALIFSGDEAETVKNVLGDRPAETLLHLCREHLANLKE